MQRKPVDVWVTRDSEDGDEPNLLFLHSKKPDLKDGIWASDVSCMAVPELERGKCKRVRLAS